MQRNKIRREHITTGSTKLFAGCDRPSLFVGARSEIGVPSWALRVGGKLRTQSQFGGLRSGWDQVGVGPGWQVEAGRRCMCVSELVCADE